MAFQELSKPLGSWFSKQPKIPLDPCLPRCCPKGSFEDALGQRLDDSIMCDTGETRSPFSSLLEAKTFQLFKHALACFCHLRCILLQHKFPLLFVVAGIQLSLLITSQKNGEIVLRPCTRHSTNALPTTNHSRSNSASEDALVIVRHALVLRLRRTEASVGTEVIQSLGTFSCRSRSPKTHDFTTTHVVGTQRSRTSYRLHHRPIWTRDHRPGSMGWWSCVRRSNDPIHQPPHQLSRRILTGQDMSISYHLIISS